MSSTPPLDPCPRPPWLRPSGYVAGLAIGLAWLSWMGWRASVTDYHPGFARFYPAISPETNYYPTLNEMTAIVRARCRHDQVLVIVGGNSILEGVWQPVADLWSRHLQDILGDRYCVINFAFRGGSPSDGGSVVAEVLRNEYPRQILIADESPLNGVEPIAHEPYRYIFWQAYFRGLLIETPARTRVIKEYQLDKGQRRIFRERAISNWFDIALHYNDLWNRICFERFCTVPSYLGDYVPAMLKPRRLFADDEPDAFAPQALAAKYPASVLDAEMRIVRNVSANFYRKTEAGDWMLARAKFDEMEVNYKEVFPGALKARTLILVSRGSPYYRRRLTPDEQARDDQCFRDAVRIWRDAGVESTDYGRDFTDDDYGDRTHLSKTGGAKLAELVAPEVRAMAAKLSYLK